MNQFKHKKSNCVYNIKAIQMNKFKLQVIHIFKIHQCNHWSRVLSVLWQLLHSRLMPSVMAFMMVILGRIANIYHLLYVLELVIWHIHQNIMLSWLRYNSWPDIYLYLKEIHGVGPTATLQSCKLNTTTYRCHFHLQQTILSGIRNDTGTPLKCLLHPTWCPLISKSIPD